MPKEGMMLQFYTSDHDWLEGRGPKIKLIGGIDDATKDVPWALFAYQDSVEENMATCKRIIKRKGIPLSLYVDKDSKFITTRHGGLHVNIKEDQEKTQMQRAWEELGINVIFAESPQAKGRIERLWGTFQDRLISELRLEGISSLEEANEYLDSVFLPKYNKKFTRKPKVKEVAYRPIPEGMDLDRILCIKEKRRVQGDHTISYKGRHYQILPTETRFGFAKAKVEVQKHLDGTIHIFYKGEELSSQRTASLPTTSSSIRPSRIRGESSPVSVFTSSTSSKRQTTWSQRTSPVFRVFPSRTGVSSPDGRWSCEKRR